MQTVKVTIQQEPFDVAAVTDTMRASDPGVGAIASFVGVCRDVNDGAGVSSMLLEHYPGMTESQLEALAADSREQHKLDDVLILHRVGEVFPSDPIVLVAAWSAHRKAAFDASREMMEKLKSVATFWKKEQLADNSRWVEKNTAG